MIDILLSALPPQASKLVESTKTEPPSVEQVAPQQSTPPLPKPTVSTPEAIPPELSTKREAATLSQVESKASIAPTPSPQTTNPLPSQLPAAKAAPNLVKPSASVAQVSQAEVAQVQLTKAIQAVNQKAKVAIAQPAKTISAQVAAVRPHTPQATASTQTVSTMPKVMRRAKLKPSLLLAQKLLAKQAGKAGSCNSAVNTQQLKQLTAPAQTQTEQPQDPKQQEFEKAKAERLKLLEQKLAEIVAREKPLKEERLRQNLKAIALNQAKAGQIEAARLTAKDMVLTPTEQTELLTQIDAAAKRSTEAKPTTKPPLKVTQLSPTLSSTQSSSPQAAPYYPSYVMPGPVLGSNIRLSQLGWKLSNGNLSLAFPLPFPAVFSSGFGWRDHPVSGDRRFHRGVDLAAAYGTPVVAAFSGKVEMADWMDGYGMTIIITHGNSTQTLYAHLSEIFVKPGDQIEQGSLIGRVGSTGLSTGPHLHFELHQLVENSWVVIDPQLQLEVAQQRLITAMQNAQNPFQVSVSLPQSFAAIPPPPTQRFDFLHNY